MNLMMPLPMIQIGCAVGSGLLLTLSHPPYGAWPAAWIALVPLFLTLRRCGTVRGGMLAFACGLSFYYTHMTWFIKIDGMTLTRHLLAGAACAWVLIPFGMAASLLYGRFPRLSTAAVPFTWVLAEYLHTHSGFLSLAWGLLAYSQYRVLPVSGLSAFYGIFGVSALIALANSLLAESIHAAWSHRKGQGSIFRFSSGPGVLIPFAGVLLMALPAFFLYVDSGKQVATETLKVAAIQGKEGKIAIGGDRILRSFRKYKELTLASDRDDPEIIVWPETAIPGRIPYDGGLVKLLGDTAIETGAHLLVGASGYDKFDRTGRERGRFANSAFLFDPDGHIAGRYDKMKLVPFNEYLPLRDRFPWPEWIVGSDWKDSAPGENLNLLSIRGIPFGVPICWENYFPEHFRRFVAAGARFIVSMNNESFISVPAAHQQMLAINVYRAVENRVPMVRSTPTGITAVIDDRGRITDTVQNAGGDRINITGHVSGKLVLGTAGTFYTRHGDWIVAILAVCSLPMTVLAFILRIREKRAHGNR